MLNQLSSLHNVTAGLKRVYQSKLKNKLGVCVSFNHAALNKICAVENKQATPALQNTSAIENKALLKLTSRFVRAVGCE